MNASHEGDRRSLIADLPNQALYEACSERVMEEIRSGALAPGSRLPSERALAAALGFSRLTVRRSLVDLAAQGALEPAEPRGWRIRQSPLSEPPMHLLSFTELARTRGLAAGAEVLELTTGEASIEEAAALRVAPGSATVRCTRLRTMDGQPVAVETVKVSQSRHAWISDFDWQTSLHDAFRSNGSPPARSEVSVDVVWPTADQLSFLAVPDCLGLLRVQGTSYDAAGNPLTLDDIRYNPTRYRFQAVLERGGASDGTSRPR